MPKTPRKRKKAAEAAPVEVAPVGVQAVPVAQPVTELQAEPALAYETLAERVPVPATEPAPLAERVPEPVPLAEPAAGPAQESSALPVSAASTAPTDAPTDAPPEAPAFKACKACSLKLPQRAKFCNACGEPQLAGLERPVYLAPSPTVVVEAPPRVPAQTSVPTVPRVAPPRSMGPTVVPSLAADRPIPASLLAPGLTPEQLQAALGSPPVFAPSPEAITSSRPIPEHGSEPERAPAMSPSPPDVVRGLGSLGVDAATGAAVPAASAADAAAAAASPAPAEPQAPLHPPAQPQSQAQPQAPEQPQPLFDARTEARILALATSREITRERFDRLMVGWRLKPKPKVKAAAAKAAPKDKAEKKAKEKPAKGH
ncbi:MAG: hypothetical protein RI972_1368 [Pseudomonadota bacterium]